VKECLCKCYMVEEVHILINKFSCTCYMVEEVHIVNIVLKMLM
jgi:hypothetical protein